MDAAQKRIGELSGILDEEEERVERTAKILLQRRETPSTGAPETINGLMMGINPTAEDRRGVERQFDLRIDALVASATERVGALGLPALKEGLHNLRREEVDVHQKSIAEVLSALQQVENGLASITVPTDSATDRIRSARSALAALRAPLERMTERLRAHLNALGMVAPSRISHFEDPHVRAAFFEEHGDLETWSIEELGAARDAMRSDPTSLGETDRLRLTQVQQELQRRRSALLVPGAQVYMITGTRRAAPFGDDPRNSHAPEQWYREYMRRENYAIPGGVVRGELAVRDGRWFLRDTRGRWTRIQSEERERLWLADEITGGPDSWTLRYPEIHPPITEQAHFLMDAQRELASRASLSREEYLRHFGDAGRNGFESVHFRQRHDGNCFLLTSLYQIFQSEHCETLIRTSVSVVGDGFIVRLPLGSPPDAPESTKITVTRQDMRESVTDFGDVTLTIPEAAMESTHDGWVALEVAYTKAFRVTRGRGGLPSESLRRLIHGSTEIKGRMWRNPALARRILEGFHPGRDFLCAGTPDREIAGQDMGMHFDPPRRFNYFSVGRYRFDCGHAYSIVDVDLGRNVIDVRNPHDTRNPILLTFEQFAEAFDNITGVRMDYGASMREDVR